MGAFSSASRTGLSRASLETRERIAPSFFARITTRGKRKENGEWHTIIIVLFAVNHATRHMQKHFNLGNEKTTCCAKNAGSNSEKMLPIW